MRGTKAEKNKEDELLPGWGWLQSEDLWTKEMEWMKFSQRKLNVKARFPLNLRYWSERAGIEKKAGKGIAVLLVEPAYPKKGSPLKKEEILIITSELRVPVEAEWAHHLCCGTLCSSVGKPLRKPNDQERFGVRPPPPPWRSPMLILFVVMTGLIGLYQLKLLDLLNLLK